MTGDIRKQLGEALDQAERLAKRAASLCGCHASAPEWTFDSGDEEGRILVVDDPHPELRRKLSRRWNGTYEGLFMAEHIARWDPSTVLRLIERDRALIERHHPESGYDRPPCVGCHANFVEDWYGTVEECPELLAAAAFWLGSSEVTDGRG